MKKSSETGYLKRVIHVSGLLWKISKHYFILNVLKAVLGAFLPYVNIYCSMLIIDGLVNKSEASSIYPIVIYMAAIDLVLGLFLAFVTMYNSSMQSSIYWKMKGGISRKTMTIDYCQIEDKKTMELIKMAEEGSNGSGDISRFMDIISGCIKGISNVVYSMVLVSAIFITVDGGTGDALFQFLNNPYSPLLIFAFILVSLVLWLFSLSYLNRVSYKAMMDNIDANRVYSYFFDLAQDYQRGKEIRIYHMQPMIMHEMSSSKFDVNSTWNKYCNLQCLSTSFLSLFTFLLTFLTYSFVGLKALYGIITIGNIISIASSVALLSSGLQSLVQFLGEAGIVSQYLDCYYRYMNLESTMEYGKREFVPGKSVRIEFRDVRFSYPGDHEETLKGVSFTMEAGKKTALVGLNGAGKTTIVKLLCRFYDPTSGEILLDGHSIKEYDRKSVYDFFSIVFQDFKLFSSSVVNNVSGSDVPDKERARKAMEKAGILERVEAMPNGMDTIIYQKTNEGGIEISGGEAQKIAIARALYKDAPIVVLDEPTSALDPKSESEIYDRFRTLVEGKTSVYISHRMSSTRFCDSIIVLKDGKVVECGNHRELMKDQDGTYHQMWMAQAKYYA